MFIAHIAFYYCLRVKSNLSFRNHDDNYKNLKDIVSCAKLSAFIIIMAIFQYVDRRSIEVRQLQVIVPMYRTVLTILRNR